MRGLPVFMFAILATALIGCGPQQLTLGEAMQALEETSLADQALGVAAGTVEITTDFTIGQAVQDAAEEIRAFIESQLPCAEVTRDGAVLTVVYGATGGSCTYRGQTFSGSHSVEVISAQAGQLQIHHEWTDLANARVRVSGTADVTWTGADSSRRVVHDLHWTRLKDDFQVTGSGDRTQTALPDGLAVGIGVEGSRDWTSPRGDWTLDIDGVQMRWIDPAPQTGTYTLTTPFEDKTATLTFQRVDEDTIAATLTSGEASFTFNINKSGTVAQD